MTTVAGDDATQPVSATKDIQAVTSDQPAKSPWDVVKEIDWGTQHDELKASVEGSGTSDASSDKPADAPAPATKSTKAST